MQDRGEFKLVTYRKKRLPCVRNSRNAHVPLPDDNDNDSDNTSCEALFGKLLEAETELRNSSFGDDIFHSLKDSLNALNIDGISEILCYGLGSFSCRRSSKYQLALLLSLKNHYGSRVHIYDPIFTPKEIQLLERFDFNVIKINEEGKRIMEDNVTLVYMPHCSVHLTNNFLYANWSKILTKCILLTNSFSAIEDHSKFRNYMLMPIDYILRIRPYVTEIALKNNFTYEEVFHDLNIHIFLERDIVTVPRDFWSEREEPSYGDATIDYFTAKQTEPVDVKNRPNEDET
ncbi:SRR1-like protein [Hylaeus volcanicus]|uniref:SRR1-like protein n=1 Tax=Hylaeus volcanicus TaxID=313075 RepID=UPI0023B775DF|nr:SRR1-like protein [Hylaeus volcanicus]